MRNLLVGMSAAFLLCSCAASGGRAPSDPAGDPATQEEAAPPSSPANAPDGTPLLQVRVTDQTTDGRVMLMRGKLTNPHAEAVQGVRMILLMGTPKGDGTYRTTDVQRKEMGSTIQPGKSTMFRWDVESQSNSGPGRFALLAVPKRLGDRDIPPPLEWTQDPPME